MTLYKKVVAGKCKKHKTGYPSQENPIIAKIISMRAVVAACEPKNDHISFPIFDGIFEFSAGTTKYIICENFAAVMGQLHKTRLFSRMCNFVFFGGDLPFW